MLELMKKFMKDEEGQDLVEYALLLVFLALAAIAILPTLGSSVNRVLFGSLPRMVRRQSRSVRSCVTVPLRSSSVGSSLNALTIRSPPLHSPSS